MTKIDPTLLEILVCPETKQKVRPASDEELARVGELQRAGRLKNRAGETVEQPVEAGLVREDGALLYPIFDEIPVMLTPQAIPLAQGEGGQANS